MFLLQHLAHGKLHVAAHLWGRVWFRNHFAFNWIWNMSLVTLGVCFPKRPGIYTNDLCVTFGMRKLNNTCAFWLFDSECFMYWHWLNIVCDSSHHKTYILYFIDIQSDASRGFDSRRCSHFALKEWGASNLDWLWLSCGEKIRKIHWIIWKRWCGCSICVVWKRTFFKRTLN